MEKTEIEIQKRPIYYRGQLLLEDDFRDEQEYHAGARRRHNLRLHDWGVVSGLEVTRKTDSSIKINAGYAIQDSGQEVVLKKNNEIVLRKFGPNEVIRVRLEYKEVGDSEGEKASAKKRRNVSALISLSRNAEDKTGVTLATIKLDDQGKIADDGIDYKLTKYVKVLGPGSITSDDLHKDLKTGWLRVPFRPVPTQEWQKDQEGFPPFKIGDTEALSWDSAHAGEQDQGSEGTMEISVPPGVTQITRLRIAGAENKDKIILQLHKSGWDQKKMEHYKETIIKEEITGEPYLNTFDVKVEESIIDPEFHTLSLELRGTKRTSVSLIAVEFGYWEKMRGAS